MQRAFPETNRDDWEESQPSYDAKRMKVPGAREAIDSIHAAGY